jgi:hypothetical protein
MLHVTQPLVVQDRASIKVISVVKSGMLQILFDDSHTTAPNRGCLYSTVVLFLAKIQFECFVPNVILT